MPRRLREIPETMYLVRGANGRFYGPYTRETTARAQATASVPWTQCLPGNVPALRHTATPPEIIELSIEQASSYAFAFGEVLDAEGAE